MDKKIKNLLEKNLEELKAIDTKILDLSKIDAFTAVSYTHLTLPTNACV